VALFLQKRRSKVIQGLFPVIDHLQASIYIERGVRLLSVCNMLSRFAPLTRKAPKLVRSFASVASLPDLPYAHNALEPHISETIMTIHHTKHHQTYVTNLNASLESLNAAAAEGDSQKIIELSGAIKVRTLPFQNRYNTPA